MIKRKENPAKLFLRRYLALSGQVDALQRAINTAMERAFNTGVTLKEVKVLSSPAVPDPMASAVCNAVDACEMLYQEKEKATAALREILDAINSLKDERQKEVLTLRYITGVKYFEIAQKMHYSEQGIYVLHGRALIEINKWIERRAHNDSNEI